VYIDGESCEPSNTGDEGQLGLQRWDELVEEFLFKDVVVSVVSGELEEHGDQNFGSYFCIL
jgi:hypothetical protein